MRRLPATLLLATVLLSGCDLLGIEPASALAAQREAEGKAIGAACRHAGRAIEDCYALNRKAEKAAIYAGWREMNDYMRENKIEPVPPQLTAPVENPRAQASDKAGASEEVASEPAAKPTGSDKHEKAPGKKSPA